MEHHLTGWLASGLFLTNGGVINDFHYGLLVFCGSGLVTDKFLKKI